MPNCDLCNRICKTNEILKTHKCSLLWRNDVTNNNDINARQIVELEYQNEIDAEQNAEPQENEIDAEQNAEPQEHEIDAEQNVESEAQDAVMHIVPKPLSLTLKPQKKDDD
ncbi:hypothetical protein BDA99DRAFT_541036 [Phascolomyces articulosus]|uniref:Uncharacterized protein n=1 Tax=Phascolomyces articulosus TaxID=60185 RepID=A0AAD5K245_9FUNG|nr:hypothetical protein BDA99DRAFT_541036 [Phascolomyces articulosus]